MPHRSHCHSWITVVAFVVLTVAASAPLTAQPTAPTEAEKQAEYVRSHYTKYEYQIPMRDGVRLFTAVYVPSVIEEAVPILRQVAGALDAAQLL